MIEMVRSEIWVDDHDNPHNDHYNNDDNNNNNHCHNDEGMIITRMTMMKIMSRSGSQDKKIIKKS